MIKEYTSYPQKAVDNFNYKLTKEEFSTNPFLKLLTFEENNTVSGFLLYSLIYDRIEIEQFEVILEKRNKKIGSYLLEYLINRYKNSLVKNITLEVKEDNMIAINLYKKYGFERVATREKYYSNSNGILLERKYDQNESDVKL